MRARRLRAARSPQDSATDRTGVTSFCKSVPAQQILVPL
jgi:hypothetical protein